MHQFIHSLYEEMKASLEEAALSAAGDPLQQAAQSCEAIQAVLQRLKAYMVRYDFKSKVEEIRFFKEIKPKFFCELIFYTELYHIELNKPMGGKKKLQSFLKRTLERFDDFLTRNRMLYSYYRTGQTTQDELFFIRDAGKEQQPVPHEYSLDLDPQFSTLHSSMLARMQAYEQLIEYIQQMMYNLAHPAWNAITPTNRPSLWTDSKTALIELAYAMHARGSINHGKGDIKTIVASLEIAFGVQVGNFYRAFQNMRIRKKNRTTYLDALKENLERHMDETDWG
ncbi:RteC domain-containing protein [Parapedobacter sp. 10938]|uniref:RteC domain-containing protein n=1 Tax=Parapedobacter flavus TaxID=3110225 RepID=UPI002DBE79F3|nr:RteC domain-containing protein [Parapedobacter sp. 10938]MEC3880203.1 RteC domain-containing protein [Parapedobacter sp. 10938]